MEADDLRNEMAALFARFLSADTASRFSLLLARRPDRWSKIGPWKVWDELDGRRVVEWRKTVAELLASPAFSTHANDLVTVLRCGHEPPGMARIRLIDALVGPSAVFEGFVSVLPGQLGIVINHDGMLCTLRHD